MANPRRPRQQLDQVAQEVAVCRLCPHLVQNRTQPVFAVGPVAAKVMLVGEAPGRDEDQQGEPFVGRAGKRLNQLLEEAGLSRGEVYITNAVKCRPPNNRNPAPDELFNCRPYLQRQVELVRPNVICSLGSIAARTLLDRKDPLGRLRGQAHAFLGVPVVCTYHPAYVLRNPPIAAEVDKDLRFVLSLVPDRADR